MLGNKTIIVGGGLAGLAAATALAERGVPVELLESRPRLGGRASSFFDRRSQTWIDNCQHVSMGCCTNFEHFCRTLGLWSLLRRDRVLHFVGPDGTVSRLQAGPFPAPFHLALSAVRLPFLSRGDLWRIGRTLAMLARARFDGQPREPFDRWLAEHGASADAVERFWHVVLVSALGETLDRVDPQFARKVFADAFLANRRGWHVLIPTVPLDRLYGSELLGWLGRHGAKVRLQSSVKQVVLEQDRAAAVELGDGELLKADHVVLAVPSHRLLPLLPAQLHAEPVFAAIDQLETAPISSVHLWFDRPVISLPHAVLVGRMSHWVFNRSLLQQPAGLPVRPAAGGVGDHGHTTSHYYQVVTSASRHWTDLRQDEVIAQVVRELGDVWPEVRKAELEHARMVTEHKAVFSVRPGVDALRPKQQSPVVNLQLAGDWTDTGWPATMEGAVRSGYLAAQNVLRQCGREERLVQSGLPVALLSRVLLGL